VDIETEGDGMDVETQSRERTSNRDLVLAATAGVLQDRDLSAILEPWDEAGQRWRRLRVTWPPYLATHNTEQRLYVDSAGLLARHDYDVEIAGGMRGAHYLSDYAEAAGIRLPTKHRIFPRSPEGQALPEPLMVSIDVSEIAFT
jgi:hypothetical protein